MKPRSRSDALAALVGDVASALRRRREAREPRVRVGLGDGSTRTLAPDDDEARRLLQAAQAVLEAAKRPPT